MVGPEDRNRVLIKFMDVKYVDSFVKDGLLYMNALQYFKEHEDSALRGDRNEGLSASLLPENITLELNGKVIEAVDKIDLRPAHNDEINLYCMTMISDKDIIDAGKDGLRLSNKFAEFGNKAVFVGGSEIAEFFRRLKIAINNSPCIYPAEYDLVVGRKVTYLDRSDHHARMSIFNKFAEYSWQFEWRLALRQNNMKGALQVRIGDLSDIAHVIDTDHLINEPIKFSRNGL